MKYLLIRFAFIIAVTLAHMVMQTSAVFGQSDLTRTTTASGANRIDACVQARKNATDGGFVKRISVCDCVERNPKELLANLYPFVCLVTYSYEDGPLVSPNYNIVTVEDYVIGDAAFSDSREVACNEAQKRMDDRPAISDIYALARKYSVTVKDIMVIDIDVKGCRDCGLYLGDMRCLLYYTYTVRITQ